MKNYLKVFVLMLFSFSCSSDDEEIIGTLTSRVEPLNSGTILRTNVPKSNTIKLVATPNENYFFIGW